MMGHISTSYTTTVAKDVQASTRYDFNIYSFDSDLVFGISYAPEQKGQKVKFRIGGSQVCFTQSSQHWRNSPGSCIGVGI